MLRVSILGTGNVATHLIRAFSSIKDVQVVQVVGRNDSALKAFRDYAAITSDFTAISDADIFIIAVRDDAIFEISQYLKNETGLIVHTSGSVSIDALSTCGRRGVFYPLQTFTKERMLDMKSVPVCLEVHHQKDADMLTALATSTSNTVHWVDSDQRKALHLGAVFVNNFTNHLYHIGQQICEANALPVEILQPLIRETVDKVAHLSPFKAQTGPARRRDSETIKKHLDQLETSPYKEVYKTMSASIKKLYQPEN